MKTFTRNIKDNTLLDGIELLNFVEHLDSTEFQELNEFSVAKLKGKIDFSAVFSKLGLSAQKERGLFAVMKSLGTHARELLFHAIKAWTGNAESKEMVKVLFHKPGVKDEIVEFLLKLDMLTLHTITGPLQIIDAITGWNIVSNLQKDKKNINDRVRKAVEALIAAKHNIRNDKIKRKLEANIARIRDMFPAIFGSKK
jgi:hypothetical protein